MAVSDEKVVGWKLAKGSVTSHLFADFIRSLDTDMRDVLLMDNASIHTAARVMNVCDERNLTPCFLPPYTPVFQPIEHAFSVVKNSYRRAEHTPPVCDQAHMEARVSSAMGALTMESLSNMFAKCWSRAEALCAPQHVDDSHDKIPSPDESHPPRNTTPPPRGLSLPPPQEVITGHKEPPPSPCNYRGCIQTALIERLHTYAAIAPVSDK